MIVELPEGELGDILVYDSGWKLLKFGDAGLALVCRGPGQTPHWQLIQGTLPPGVQHGDIMFFDGTLWTILSPGTAGYILETGGVGADPSWIANTGLPAGAQGDIIYHNGANWVVLNAGTSGQFFITKGAGANPQWSDFILETPQEEDLRVPLTAVRTAGASVPSWTKVIDDGGSPASTGVYAWSFSTAKTEEVFFDVQLPHGWKNGTNITPHVHWMPPDGNAGNVVWELEYTWANIDAAFGNTTVDTITVASPGVALQHTLSEFAAIDATGKTFSSMLICRLARTPGAGGDTYASAVFGIEADFHMEMDKLGE